MKKIKLLSMTAMLLTTVAGSAQVIDFSIEEEKNSQNTPEGWEKVQLPELPEFTAENTFYITDAQFGASTSSADNTAAIQKALDEAAAKGGGMVVIPEGEFISNTIEMGSKTVLHLCKGAVLKWMAYEDRSHTVQNNFITHKGTPTDVVIEGEGPTSIIEGQGGPWWDAVEKKEDGLKRGSVIRFGKGNRFLFRNFRIQNAPGTNLTVGQSGNGAHATVHDIDIYAPSSTAADPSHNTDGIPVWTQYVNIYNCTIDTGDDNVVCDSQAQYVHVWNCTFKAGHGASFGSYTTDMHHIIYEDLILEGTDCGFRLKSNRDRSGDVHDIIFRRCKMTNVPTPIVITAWYDSHPNPADAAKSPEEVISTTPKFHNILIKDVTAEGYVDGKNSNNKNYNGINIYGRPESPVYDVTFDNVQISHRNGVRFYFCKDIKFINNCKFTRTKDNKTVLHTDTDLSAVTDEIYDAAYTWHGNVTDTGGIDAILASDPSLKAAGWYDLNGRKVADCYSPQLPKGIYIVNGRKVIIK